MTGCRHEPALSWDVHPRRRRDVDALPPQNPGLKERISKIREAEKKLGSDVADRVKTMQVLRFALIGLVINVRLVQPSTVQYCNVVR